MLNVAGGRGTRMKRRAEFEVDVQCDYPEPSLLLPLFLSHYLFLFITYKHV